MKSPCRMQVGSGIKKSVQLMGPAAHRCSVVYSIHSIQEGRPEERVVTMELLLFYIQQPFLCWFSASYKVLVSVDSFRMQKSLSLCLLKSFFLFPSVPPCCPLPSMGLTKQCQAFPVQSPSGILPSPSSWGMDAELMVWPRCQP